MYILLHALFCNLIFFLVFLLLSHEIVTILHQEELGMHSV